VYCVNYSRISIQIVTSQFRAITNHSLCSERIVELLHNIEYRFAQRAPTTFSPTTRSFSARVGEIKATAVATTSSINCSYICEYFIYIYIYIYIFHRRCCFRLRAIESLNSRTKQFSGARDFPNICTSITRRRTQYRWINISAVRFPRASPPTQVLSVRSGFIFQMDQTRGSFVKSCGIGTFTWRE